METYRQDWLGAIKWLMTDPFNLDLDALEREYTGPSDNVIRDQRILALIQRLREADQQLTEMAETFGGQADRIERYEAELNDWRQPNMLTEVEYRERTTKLRARLAQLERVREAAQELEDSLDPTERGPVDQILLAALAAVEESVKL